MPDQEKSHLNQKAVLWVANGFSEDGKVKVNAAVEVNVRWEEISGEAGGQGNTITFDSRAAVDREAAVNDIMWLGNLRDVAASPTNLRKVVSYSKIPDVKGRSFRRTVLLNKFSNELPTVNS